LKQFQTAARRGATAVNNPVPVDFEYEVRKGEYLEMTAHPPTSGQISLFAIGQMKGGLDAVNAVFKLLNQVLGEKDWAIIERDLEDGVDVAVLVDIVNYCVEVWGGNPTSSASGSSRSRASTGKRSTVRQRGEGSTS
jgi:hypothetical protein